MHIHRRFYAPTALLVALAAAAPAQAAVTATTVTSPAKTRFVLYDTSAPHPKTLAVAGTATGSGDVDIVCARGTDVVSVLEDVPVAANGTFAASDVPLEAAADAAHPEWPGRSCHLRAVPAGTTPPVGDQAFEGPMLGVSKYSQLRIDGGGNDGLRSGYYLYAAGLGYATSAGAFGSCGLYSVIQDSQTLEERGDGVTCAGAARDDYDQLGVAIDGEAAYAPGAIAGGVAGAGIQGGSGFPELPEPSIQFDEDTGDVTVTETSPFARCAPDNAFPPHVATCTTFERVPVQVDRTTSIAGGAQLVRIVERWSSTDGRAHTLDATYNHPSCFGSGYDCSEKLEYRFPGETAYARHDANGATPETGAVAGPFLALAPVFVRDGSAGTIGGAVIIPGQSADGARFYERDEFGLDYTGRTIPASGTLTLTHYYATVSGADLEDGAARLRAWIGQPPSQGVPAPGGAGGPVAHTPARPQLSRGGRVRVRRSGRTFVVTTSDRVRCPAGGAACVLRVGAKARGAIAGTARRPVAPGTAARVTFRLRRSAADALKRLGRLRLTVMLSARAGTGAPVTGRRTITLRLA